MTKKIFTKILSIIQSCCWRFKCFLFFFSSLNFDQSSKQIHNIFLEILADHLDLWQKILEIRSSISFSKNYPQGQFYKHETSKLRHFSANRESSQHFKISNSIPNISRLLQARNLIVVPVNPHSNLPFVQVRYCYCVTELFFMKRTWQKKKNIGWKVDDSRFAHAPISFLWRRTKLHSHRKSKFLI